MAQSLRIVATFLLLANSVSCGNKIAFEALPPQLSSNAGGGPPPTNNGIPALYCNAGGQNPTPTQYYPTGCLVNPGLPKNAIGFEMNNLESNHLILTADDPIKGIKNSVYVYVEFSTYVQADTAQINAHLADGTIVPLLNNCNISTYTKADPTNGKVRPYSDSILQFNVALPAGTVSLDFDFTGALSPTYMGVWNLNEFGISLKNPATNPFTGGAINQFRVQSAPPGLYNDNLDPLVAEPACPNF